MLADDERIVLRPKIARVRDILNDGNCIEMNPFLRGYDQVRLLKVFEEFAGDVEKAGRILKEMTGVNPMAFKSVPSSSGFLARGYISDINHGGKGAELVLSNAFQAHVSGPYFTLRELEAMEQAKCSLCFGKAQKAMDGLGNLYAMARAVPMVYEQISAPSLNGAA